MDFDTSKENIQPLRGGRNPGQLQIGLQAQQSLEHQQQLMLQKEEYENRIRHYEGDDPLNPYYQYISWIEQSYPKHCEVGNLNSYLHHCLTKFQDDQRYINDRRFCKLWIKYIDMQENPIEMYKLLYSNGTCKGCADLYKAWAYYHEAASDFRSANDVFEIGKKECAQPYDELHTAYENMVFAAGQQMIHGVNQKRLTEERQALTMLQTFNKGMNVGNVRVASSSNPGVLPSTVNPYRSNVPIQVYDGESEVGAVAAAPINILAAVKRDITKENFMKPGTWTSARVGSSSSSRTPAFSIHVEGNEPPEVRGVQLPKEYIPQTHEDFSEWKSDICIPDPDDPTKIPMYCKRLVYIDPNTEYSIEEVRSRRYMRKNRSRLSVPFMETEQAIQSIIGNDLPHEHSEIRNHMFDGSKNISQHNNQVLLGSIHQQPDQIEHLHQSHFDGQNASYLQQQINLHPKNSPHYSEAQEIAAKSQNSHYFTQQPEVLQLQDQASSYCSPLKNALQNVSFDNSFRGPPQIQSPHFMQQQYASPIQTPPSQKSITEKIDGNNYCDALWSDERDDSDSSIEIRKPPMSKFTLFEESAVFQRNQLQVQPKGSAMKTPFKSLNDDDLAETGSRGGMDTAATAQPADCAKRLPIYEDSTDDSSLGFATPEKNFNSTNTEMFFQKVMHVSTPQNLPNKLSFIMEERSSCISSSSGSGNSGGINKGKALSNMQPIEEERSLYRSTLVNSKVNTENDEDRYHSNLAQNMKANAALRSSLLGELMDCDTQPSTPTTDVPHPMYLLDDEEDEEEEENEDEDFEIKEYVPYAVLQNAPSNPFKPAVIERLLQHVHFPGRHTQGYVHIQGHPKLAVKKIPCTIGKDRYIIEKLLGKGTFGSVFKGMLEHTTEPVALKIQKPPNKWEYYICRELQSRLANRQDLCSKFMNVQIGYFGEGSSVLISEFSPYGSLLEVANSLKTKIGRTMKPNLCIYFTLEMLNIVQAMHEAKIIHADIKPDNFLVTLKENVVGLQLIDFGCSIDMSLYPEGTMFTHRISTSGFVSCEMEDGRPWSYHTDLFCVAASTHVLLFDKYIHLQKKENVWSITQKLSRYLQVDLWNTFFYTLLNMQECLPDVENLKGFLRGYLGDITHEMRELTNVLKNR